MNSKNKSITKTLTINKITTCFLYKKTQFNRLTTLGKENLDFLKPTQSNLSKNYYHQILAYDLILKQNYKTLMELPRLKKIVLNTTSKKYLNDKKLMLLTLAALELLSGQKPQLTYAKNSIANFKIRQHQILGCTLVLRENLLYSFLDKLSKIIFPSIRDFLKKNQTGDLLSKHSDHKLMQVSAHNFGLKNLMIFPELETNYDLVDAFHGMNLTFVFAQSTKKNSSLLLSGFQIPQ
jgi:large subunit ribosomal protein L5|nr:ribosomal protein L5 [Chlorella vulgaris]